MQTKDAFPMEATSDLAQQSIIDAFAFFSDWQERYQYIIDLGHRLPDFPDKWKIEAHRLHGCQSMVWIVASGDHKKVDISAVSDSAIVSGLIYLALKVYAGRSAQEILSTQPKYLGAIGLQSHLSMARNHGQAALLTAIQTFAQEKMLRVP